MKAYKNLENLFRQLFHLDHVRAICNWDEAVMMPPGGGTARAEAMGSLQALSHQQLINPQNGEWIEEAKSAELDAWQSANLKWMEKNYLKAICLPEDLVKRSVVAFIRCEQAWRTLRSENNWQGFSPLLQENLRLVREKASIEADVFAMDPYDCLIDDFSPDLSQSIIDPIFAELEKFLPGFIPAVMERQSLPVPVSGHFSVENQRQLGLELMRSIGFDFNHGRLDVSHHPFCGGVSQDVRITTRYSEEEFFTAAMGVCHETGHALYERGLPEQWLDQPVGHALGMAVHESQSLLIEMQACRSHAFMQFLSPLLSQYFGEQPGFTPDNLFKCYTQVKPGLIRVDADEVSYPLHIILRYNLEKKLIKGEIDVKDLPELWNDYMQKWLGLNTRGDYKNGVMQDVHWPTGAFGYFPAYTIGAMIAAQLFSVVLRQCPDIPTEIASGSFKSLVGWLRKHVHGQGRLLPMNELLIQATGEPLSVAPFITHLKERYLS